MLEDGLECLKPIHEGEGFSPRARFTGAKALIIFALTPA